MGYSERVTPDKVYAETDCIAPDDIRGYELLVVRNGMKKRGSGQMLCLVTEADTSFSKLESRFPVLDVRKNQRMYCNKRDIMGVLNPERISEKDCLLLGLIKPIEDTGVQKGKPIGFFGYCFLKNGTYQGAVHLSSKRELEAYVKLQSRYQYRLMICDSDDYIVLEVEEGSVVFPTKEMLEKEGGNEE